MEAAPSPRSYRPPVRGDWWLSNRNYFLYVVREFTAIPTAAWMLWFLVEVARVRGGAGGYRPHASPAFLIFSVVCLGFALWHSFTFLSLSGLIMRIPMGQRTVPAGAIAGASFVLLIAASIVIGALLVWGWR